MEVQDTNHSTSNTFYMIIIRNIITRYKITLHKLKLHTLKLQNYMLGISPLSKHYEECVRNYEVATSTKEIMSARVLGVV